MPKLGMIVILTSLMTGVAIHVQSQDDQNRLVLQAESAAQRAVSDTLEAHEVNMIEYRRSLMGQPGLQLYVVFFNDLGQPIDYFVTNGKCTSANKRLLQSWKFEFGQTGRNSDGALYGDFVMPAASLDGTYGSSDDYIYCKTADGKYKQWSGRYYASDTPIELTIKPLITDASGNIQSQN